MTGMWQEAMVAAFRNTVTKVASILPGLLAMLMLLILGVVVGALARTIVARIARAFRLDERTQAWGLAPGLGRAGVGRSASDIAGRVAFWAVFLFFATTGIDALGIPGTHGATEAVTLLIPRLLVGLLILIVGWVLANFIGQALLITAVNAGVPEARLLARATRWGILLFAFATTLSHIGIGRDMVLLAFSITFGGLVLSLALAFGLGGRTLAREILERRLRREQPPRPHDSLTHL